VTWGDPDPDPDLDHRVEPARPRGFGAALTALRHDRRVALTAAGLGAIALVGSLIGEWQITTMRQDGSTTDFGSGTTVQQLTAGVGGIGIWGAGYLVGVFLAVAGTAVVLFGSAAGRGQIRLAALSVCGTLLAVLAAAWNELGQHSAALNGLFLGGPGNAQVTLAQGRGISAALVATLLIAAALVLAGGSLPTPRAAPAEVGPAEQPAQPMDPNLWRPRRAPLGEDERPAEPTDLTVTPVAPFTTPGDGRTQA
jgi:hypothetical protein